MSLPRFQAPIALTLVLVAAVSSHPCLGQAASPTGETTASSGGNPGMIITNQDGEALPLNERGNVSSEEDMPGGFGEHSTAYTAGSASTAVAIANPEWNTVGPDGSTISLGGGSTNVSSRFLEPGHYVMSNAGAVRVGDSTGNTSSSSAVAAGAQIGIDVEDKTSPAILIKVVPQDTYQVNSCAVKEEPLDVYPTQNKTFGIHLLGPNFDPALQEQRIPERVSRERIVPAANEAADGTVQNSFNLDSQLNPIMPDGRIYVPANVRCGITVDFADNDPAQAVPGDPSSTYQPETKWYEVHRLRGAAVEPEIEKNPETYIFRSPTNESLGPVYSIVAYAEDRTGNVSVVRIPVTVFTRPHAVQRIEFEQQRAPFE